MLNDPYQYFQFCSTGKRNEHINVAYFFDISLRQLLTQQKNECLVSWRLFAFSIVFMHFNFAVFSTIIVWDS